MTLDPHVAEEIREKYRQRANDELEKFNEQHKDGPPSYASGDIMSRLGEEMDAELEAAEDAQNELLGLPPRRRSDSHAPAESRPGDAQLHATPPPPTETSRSTATMTTTPPPPVHPTTSAPQELNQPTEGGKK